MTWYVAHLDTGFCGTGNYEVFEADDDMQADEYLPELVYDNASQYFQVVSVEDYAEMCEDNDFDESGYVSEDEIYGEVVEYSSEEHDDYLEQWQIDEVNE